MKTGKPNMTTKFTSLKRNYLVAKIIDSHFVSLVKSSCLYHLFSSVFLPKALTNICGLDWLDSLKFNISLNKTFKRSLKNLLRFNKHKSWKKREWVKGSLSQGSLKKHWQYLQFQSLHCLTNLGLTFPFYNPWIHYKNRCSHGVMEKKYWHSMDWLKNKSKDLPIFSENFLLKHKPIFQTFFLKKLHMHNQKLISIITLQRWLSIRPLITPNKKTSCFKIM